MSVSRLNNPDIKQANNARSYDMVGLPSSDLNAILIGCQGENNAAQYKVAELINDLFSLSPHVMKLMLFCGDNTYKYGMIDPRDPRFETHFYDYYQNPQLPFSYPVPALLALGNHDGNYLKGLADFIPGLATYMPTLEQYLPFHQPYKKGNEVEMHQVNHTYLSQDTDPLGCNKAELFSQPAIRYKELPKWCMPNRMTSWKVGQLRFIVANSNTLLSQYADLLIPERWKNGPPFTKVKPVPAQNEAIWLIEENKKAHAAGETPILIQHHPLYDAGKRAYPNHADASLYLDKTKRDKLCSFLGLPDNCQDYSRMLLAFNQHENLPWFMVICAHVHALYNRNNINDPKEPYKVWQITTGGGGGTLQGRKKFGDPNMGGFCRQHGLFQMRCNVFNPRETMEISLITTDNTALHFVALSPHPVREAHQQPCVIALRQSILAACQEVVPGNLNAKEKNILDKLFLFLKEPNLLGLASHIMCMAPLIEALPNQDWPASLYQKLSSCPTTSPELANQTFQELYQDILAVEKLRTLVLAHCLSFQNFLQDRQDEQQGNFLNYRLQANQSTIEKDIDILHNLINFLNQADYHTLEETILTLHTFTLQFKNPYSIDQFTGPIDIDLKNTAPFNASLKELNQSRYSGLDFKLF